MDTLTLKSFLPEIFFSLGIVLQVILNTRWVNTLNFNFPLVETENFYQNFFILSLLLLFFIDLRLEGYLGFNMLYVNSSILYLKQVFVIVCLVALILSYQAHLFQKINFIEFYSIFFLSILGLLLMLSTADLMFFFLTMEMQALCFYVIGSSNRTSIFSIEAGLKYFISGSFFSGIYLLGVSLIYGALGSINLNEIDLLLSFDFTSYNSDLMFFFNLGLVFILVTLLFKVACAPFHFWAPDVYDGSPFYATIIFSILPKIPLYFFFIKILDMLHVIESISSNLLLNCGLLSVILGTFFAISQKRLKRLIIYSSIMQTGFIVAGISMCSLNGYTYSIFFLLIYLITSVVIWGLLIIFYTYSFVSTNFSVREIESLFLPNMSNLIKYNLIGAFFFLIVFFSIGGIPPLTGFLSKMLILLSLVLEKYYIEAIFMLVVSSISVYYYLRLLKVIYFEPQNVLSIEEYKGTYVHVGLNWIYFLVSIAALSLLFIFYNPTMFILFGQIVSLAI